MKKVVSAILLVAACAVGAYADASLYLYPRAEMKAGGLAFSDIAIIESDMDTAARIGSAVISDALVSDGYLEESEIRQALAGMTNGRLSIYGSAVRVAVTAKPAPSADAAVAVKKGAQVRFHVIRSCVRVEMSGIALQDGAVGEVIPVKLKGSAVSRGTVVNERTVELEL